MRTKKAAPEGPKTRRLLPHRAAIVETVLVVLMAAATLLAMANPPICVCGTVKLWHAFVQAAA